MAKRHYRVLRPALKPQTPIEALEFTEEIQRIEFAIDLISKMNPIRICEERTDGEQQIRSWLVSLRKSLRYAQTVLRRDFLSVLPPPKIIETRH
jgi:hypothetical protein